MTDLTLRQIDKIRTLLAEALENGGLRALDRDTVTAALRDLYDEVLAMPATTRASSSDEAVSETASSSAPAENGDAVSADGTDDGPAAKGEPERNSRLADVTVPWAETAPAGPETAKAAGPETAERPEPEEENAADDGDTTEADGVAEPGEVAEQDGVAEQDAAPEETDAVEETDTVKDDAVKDDAAKAADTVTAGEAAEEDDDAGEAEELAQETAGEGTEEEIAVIVPEETDEETGHDPVEEITLSAEPILPEPTRLERMLADERSLAARLGKERLDAVADELCYGDTETCLDMMEALEATGDFDMAVLYIQEHYPQKSDSRAIDMLVEVLSAKFI